MKREKWFNPHKSFFELKIVLATACVVFVGFLLMVVIIWLNSDLTADPSYEGFNSFLTIYRVPIGFLALLIPLGAIYAANHRSEQTRTQIIAAESQNNFSNYFKHLEEFEKHISIVEVREEFETKYLNSKKLHARLFPYAREGYLYLAMDYYVFCFLEILDSLLEICVIARKSLSGGVSVNRYDARLDFPDFARHF